MNKKRYMKNPNGFGGVSKLSGKRRKPWMATVTKDWVYDAEKGKCIQKKAVIGYYATRQEALTALVKYNDDPYDIKSDGITFAEVYDKWSEDYFNKIVPSAVRTVKSAYNHSRILWNRRFKDLRTIDLEQTIKNAEVGDSTKQRMKSMYNLMYKYALKHEIVTKDYAALCETVKRGNPNKIPVPFTEKEVNTLWDNLDFPFVDMILIGIYTGFRPQELSILKIKDVNLDSLTIVGGLKTDSGKNRTVPVNDKIIDLVKNRYNKDNTQLFEDENGIGMTYDKYRNRFNKVMKYLKMQHRPHETRHTFITLMKEACANEYILKILVGHEIIDLTEKVYTHRSLEELRREINKI